MTETPLPEQYKRSPRLYVDGALVPGAPMALADDQAHYLRNVMRLNPGDTVRVFNGRDGEWLATLAAIGKKSAVLEPVRKIAAQTSSADIWAVASPVKKEAFELMIEKATELGAARFIPVLCDRTVARRVNDDRILSIAIEAAEQSERLDVPVIAPLAALKSVLSDWPQDRKLIVCLERESAEPIATVLEKAGDVPLAVLVGPEGGFSPEEVKYMRTLPFIMPVSLGSRILRAETALLAALACVQAFSCCREA